MCSQKNSFCRKIFRKILIIQKLDMVKSIIYGFLSFSEKFCVLICVIKRLRLQVNDFCKINEI